MRISSSFVLSDRYCVFVATAIEGNGNLHSKFAHYGRDRKNIGWYWCACIIWIHIVNRYQHPWAPQKIDKWINILWHGSNCKWKKIYCLKPLGARAVKTSLRQSLYRGRFSLSTEKQNHVHSWHQFMAMSEARWEHLHYFSLSVLCTSAHIAPIVIFRSPRVQYIFDSYSCIFITNGYITVSEMFQNAFSFFNDKLKFFTSSKTSNRNDSKRINLDSSVQQIY